MGTVFKALTIAGSDSGGGAGIQADLKTFQELDVFGMSAITAVTAQNTLGVHGVYPLPLEAVDEQLDAIGTDLQTDAVKTGMLYSSELIERVAAKIKQYEWDKLVIDPVMVAKGGHHLLQDDAVDALCKHLIPLALVVTPNLPEAEILTGRKLETMEERKDAARSLHAMGARHVVIKGGHGTDDEVSVDLLYDGRSFLTFSGERIKTRHTHGTGCTFAAAVTSGLAKGYTVEDSIQLAKDFIQAAIADTLKIGQGHGPTNHWAYARKEAAKADDKHVV